MKNRLFSGTWFFVACGAAALFGLPLAAPATSAGLPEPVVPGVFGVNIHFTSPQIGEMEKLASVGFGVVRMDFAWQSVEKIKGIYDFTAYDKLTDSLSQNKIRPLYILDYGNPLYEGGKPSETSEGRAAYAAFASAAAEHFKNRGILWEIWNEPNSNTFWKNGANADKYADLAIPAARAIRAADASATILAPASSRFVPWKFFDTVFRRGLLKEIDAVSVHPYRMPATQPETAAAEFRQLRRLIAVHTAPGDKQVGLVCSEWGYSTFEKGISEAQQARFLAREWLSNLAEGVNLSIWYDWRDDGTNSSDAEANFGTVKRDFSPKPAFVAAQNLIHDLNGFRFIHRLNQADPNLYSLLFRKGSAVALASWNSDPAASEDDQTPKVRFVLPTDADFAVLKRSAALDYETVGLVAVSGQPARLNFTVSNPDAAPTTLQIAVAGKTQKTRLAKGQTETVSFDLPSDLVTSGSQITMPVEVIWNGQKIEAPPVELQAAYPLLISTVPIASGVRVEISNPRSIAFSGELEIANAGKNSTLKAEIPASATRSFDFVVDSAQPTILSATDLKGAVWAHLGPFSFQPLPGFPTNLGESGLFNVVSHVKNAPQQPTQAMGIEVGADAPVKSAVAISFEPLADSLYRTLSPTKTSPIPAAANSVMLWVYSDGNGLPLVARFRDSMGQVFQPTLTQLFWKGWKAVTIPLSGDMWHFGGPNDGIPRGPLTLDALLLLDNSRAQTAQGRILAAEPSYVVGESSLPGIPGL